MVLRLLLAALVATACGLLSAMGRSHADAGFPDDVTLQGTIESALGMPFNSYGGTVLFTFTPDMSGLLRVEIRDFVVGSDYPLQFRSTYDRVMHYSPPQPIVDGMLTAGLGLNEIGMGRVGLGFQGTIISPSEVSGTASVSCLITTCTLAAPWSAAEPIDTPPDGDDIAYKVNFADREGTLLLALDEQQNVTSFALLDVPFDECESSYRFNVRTFFSVPPALTSLEFGARVAQQYGAFVQDVQMESGVLSGTLRLMSGPYRGDCEVLERWTIGEIPTETPPARPTATSTPAAPALPPTGSGPVNHKSALPIASFAAVGATLLMFGLARGRRV